MMVVCGVLGRIKNKLKSKIGKLYWQENAFLTKEQITKILGINFFDLFDTTYKHIFHLSLLIEVIIIFHVFFKNVWCDMERYVQRSYQDWSFRWLLIFATYSRFYLDEVTRDFHQKTIVGFKNNNLNAIYE